MNYSRLLRSLKLRLTLYQYTSYSVSNYELFYLLWTMYQCRLHPYTSINSLFMGQHSSPIWCPFEPIFDAVSKRPWMTSLTFCFTATEGLPQELKPKQWMYVRCYTHPSPGWQHLDFICKNVLSTHRIYTVSLPNIVFIHLSTKLGDAVCSWSEVAVALQETSHRGEWCGKLGGASPEQNVQGRRWSAKIKPKFSIGYCTWPFQLEGSYPLDYCCNGFGDWVIKY